MEVAAESLLVSEAGDAHDHRVLEAGRLTVCVLTAFPSAEELQRSSLATDLVDRVVEIGQVLDLWERQAACLRHPLREPEDGRLVEDGVEHAAAAEALVESLGRVIDAAFAGYVLTEEHCVGIRGEQVGQRLRDPVGEVPAATVFLWEPASEGLEPLVAICHPHGALFLARQRERRHDVFDRGELRSAGRLLCRSPQPEVGVFVERGDIVPADGARG